MEKKSFSKKDTALIATVAILAIALVAVMIIFSEKTVEPKSKTYYDLFDTVSTVYDYSGGSEEEFREALEALEELFYYYDALFDIYHPSKSLTNLYDVNREATKAPVKVDGALLDFLEYSKQMYTLTGGEVNIAMGAVLSIWHTARTQGLANPAGAALPPRSELSDAAEHCDINDIIIDREASTVYLADPQMSLDVGAIAKGYATERAAELLLDLGYTGYALDIGGNLRTVGSKADGDPWRTGVKNTDLTSEKKYVYYLNLSDLSAVTSGDYERYYTVGGKRYHHIIDKDTLMPSAHFSSVTVVVQDSGLADALSTALFNMDYESGKAIVEATAGAFAVWVYQSGDVKTAGIEP